MDQNTNITMCQVLAHAIYQIRILLSNHLGFHDSNKSEVAQAANLSYALHNEALAILEGKTSDVTNALEKIKNLDKIYSSNLFENISNTIKSNQDVECISPNIESNSINNVELNKIIDQLNEIEKTIKDDNIYAGFNGHGHLKYIQATDEGLLKLGMFFLKSILSKEKYIHILSEEKQIEWVDPDSEEAIDYIEKIDIDNIDEFLIKRIQRRIQRKK